MSEVGTTVIDVEPSTAVAELRGVARRFGRRWALRGVSIRVGAGEAVGLVGANGSGKTTLLRIVATALRPTRGGGRVLGHDLVAEAAEVRQVVGLLGHQPGLYDDLTAAENLRFGIAMTGSRPSDAAIGGVLERSGLGPVADERVRGFSSGMKRRVALARLLLRPPRLLLLDEPYASFDVAGIDLVNALVVEVVSGGGAALVATHDPARGADVLDRVIRLDAGLVVDDSVVLAAVPPATSHGDGSSGPGVAAAGAQMRIGGRP